MRCPTLKELPLPPLCKTGWPWTEESPQLPDTMPDGSLWPKISIVTPSFNQGQFIEETIRSVLLQGYPDLEYIIIDGGSNDGSADIIKKYEEWLKYWISEPDSGQSNAINKGFNRASGEIFAYLNSDDLYEQNALAIVSSYFINSNHVNIHFLAGKCDFFNDAGYKKTVTPWWPDNISHYLTGSTFAQPATFWSRTVHLKIGGFDERFHFCIDNEFYLRITLLGIIPKFISEKIARFRNHKNSKTYKYKQSFQKEYILIIKKHGTSLNLTEQQKAMRIEEIDKSIHYWEVFTTWKKKGRIYAIFKFIHMIKIYPLLLFRRQILGLARRLVFYRYKSVKELETI